MRSECNRPDGISVCDVTREEVGHVRVQVLQYIDGSVKEIEGVIIPIQEPLVAIAIVPAKAQHLPLQW